MSFFSQVRRLSLVAALGIFSVPLVCQAALLTSASDRVFSNAASTATNHEVVFKTPTGVDASTDTIVLEFPGFTFGSLAVGDIDLSYGIATGFETSAVLASTAAAGVWGVSVSGTTITFTAPTNAAVGTVTAGFYVGVRIGTNATGGANQLTNPASVGSAQVSVSGTFGDEGTMGVAISANPNVTVSATVVTTSTPAEPEPNGSSGGGGSSNNPVNPPLISNVQILNITSSGATVQWQTDKSSDSQVPYGLTISYASGTATDGASGTAHSIALASLSPGTVYHLKVRSTDPATLLSSESGDFTFTTLTDQASPVISNIQVQNITDNSALVTWNTNEPATSAVEFGLTSAYGLNASQVGLVTSHAVTLNGLTKNTVYHLRVNSADVDGNLAQSGDVVFTTTGDVTPPPNPTLQATPGDGQILLSWTVPNVPDLAGVKIVKSSTGYPSNPFNGTEIYSGTGSSVMDAAVTNGTTYFYAAFAFDADGNFSSGSLTQATPQASLPPPVLPPPLPPAPIPPVPPAQPGVQQPPSGQVQPPIPGVPQPPIPIPVPSPSAPVVPVIFQGQGNVVLSPDPSGAVFVLPGSILSVIVPIASLPTIGSATLSIGSSQYNLSPSPDGTSLIATVTVPAGPGQSVFVVVQFSDGTQGVTQFQLSPVLGGTVIEATLFGGDVGIPGAEVQIRRMENGFWNVVATVQSSDSGAYAVVVPNGLYSAIATKEGYETAETPTVFVSNNVFNQVIQMIRIVPFVPATPTGTTETVTVSDTLSQLPDAIQYQILRVQEFFAQPEVREVTEGMRTAVVAVSAAALASSSFNILALLQSILTQPLLLLQRKKRNAWGIVFNALTRQPIDLAIIRLISAKTKQVTQTRVTDRAGRYFFFVAAGEYILEVVKPGFLFPAKLLKREEFSVDSETPVNLGDSIVVQKDVPLTQDIPLDPEGSVEKPRKSIWKKYGRLCQRGISAAGVVLALGVALVVPSFWNFGVFGLQLVVYRIFKRIAVPPVPKPWGIVRGPDRKPLSNAIVRVFDKKFNKLLETQVTGREGQYGFFIGKSVYYVTIQKAGYETFTGPDIDATSGKKELIGVDIALKPIART